MEFVTTLTLRASGKRDGSKSPERGITWILERGHAHRLGFRGRFLVLSRSFDGGYADRLAAGER